MTKHRTHSVEFKRQVPQECLAGETLHGLSKRCDISRNLIRVYVEKYQAGARTEVFKGGTSAIAGQKASVSPKDAG